MSMPLEPLNFVVDSLISPGLHILAGSPKVGKSWLALWLSVMVAKGEPIWGMETRQGTTLYLCLEDSTRRIQNRLYDIGDDASSDVHFCTESYILGRGLEEQIERFIAEHRDTVLIIIDTLQMIRGAKGGDYSYASDYNDLSALKKIADRHSVAVLLIHHLRKEKADDVFNRISGTTAISGAVDSNFTIVEKQRGSSHAVLHCVGRDIEYREIELERGEDNVWQMVSDTRDQPEMLGGSIVRLVAEFMNGQSEYIGTPTELSEKIDPDGVEGITPKKISGQIRKSIDCLRRIGISAVIRRSNGRRIIELHRAASDAPVGIDPTDPVEAFEGDFGAITDEVG